MSAPTVLLVPARLDFDNGDCDVATLCVGLGPDDVDAINEVRAVFRDTSEGNSLRPLHHAYAWERRASLVGPEAGLTASRVEAAYTPKPDERVNLTSVALLVNATHVAFEGEVSVRFERRFAKLRARWMPWPIKTD